MPEIFAAFTSWRRMQLLRHNYKRLRSAAPGAKEERRTRWGATDADRVMGGGASTEKQAPLCEALIACLRAAS